MNAVSHISDGLLEKDKKNVNNVAKLVATVVNCQYTLKRHMWNDISDEWPFYTDQERALFRYWIFSKQKFRLTKKRNMDALSIECYGWMQGCKVIISVVFSGGTSHRTWPRHSLTGLAPGVPSPDSRRPRPDPPRPRASPSRTATGTTVTRGPRGQLPTTQDCSTTSAKAHLPTMTYRW